MGLLRRAASMSWAL